MVFDSPVWLLGFLPWGAVVVYLLRGKGPANAVPYLELWGGVTAPSRRRRYRLPPASTLWILFTLFLVVLAAAKPIRVLNQSLRKNDFNVEPEKAQHLVAITAMGARLFPHPQVMVRLENDSDCRSATLRVNNVTEQILLSPQGMTTDCFVDVDNLGDVITAQIETSTEKAPSFNSSLVKQNRGVKIVSDSSLPEAIRRIVAIYSKNRPSDAMARLLTVSRHRIDPNQAGIWVDADLKQDLHRSMPVALIRNVTTWPEGDFFAVQENPARQIWMKSDFRGWEKTTDFVIFFANAFDWLSEGAPDYKLVKSVSKSETVSFANPLISQRRPVGCEMILIAIACLAVGAWSHAQRR